MATQVLDFVSKLMQPSMRSRVEEYVQNRSTSGPLIVEFDPTTACNFTCPECISILLLNKGQIEAAQTLALIDEFQRAGVRGVIFIGGGEPLAQKGMPAPIQRCHDHGIAVGLTTNGSLIDRYLDTLATCVSWTRVSVDAATQETFSIFRPSPIRNSFQKVTKNMEMLAKTKTGLLGFSFLLMERAVTGEESITNAHEVFVAAKLAKELGCDYFEYKPMVDEHHNLIPLSDEVKVSLRAQMDEMVSLNDGNFRVIAPHSIPHLLNGTTQHQPKSYHTCPTLEMRTLITPKGIYPCPYKRGYEEVKIGSIELRFDEYWTSDERKKRAQLIDPSTDCQFYCIRHDMNLLLLSLAQAHDDGIDLLPYMIETDTQDVFV